MMETLQLDVGDMIQMRTTSLDLAKLVRLQPQSVNFLDISDPRAVLEKAFRNFATLTAGDVFNFEYNDDVYSVAVLNVKPESEKMGVSMIETDVSVDFAPPVGYVEPERQPRTSGTSTPAGGARAGGGVPAGGVLHPQGTMATAINYGSIAPGSALASSTRFVGEGQKLKSAKAATPVPTEVGNAAAPTPVVRRRDGPEPLRLGPNKLFFGYEIKPVKTDEEKKLEANGTKKHHFTGQGQVLKSGAKKGDADVNKG